MILLFLDRLNTFDFSLSARITVLTYIGAVHKVGLLVVLVVGEESLRYLLARYCGVYGFLILRRIYVL